jgi:hypothetical protein
MLGKETAMKTATKRDKSARGILINDKGEKFVIIDGYRVKTGTKVDVPEGLIAKFTSLPHKEKGKGVVVID